MPFLFFHTKLTKWRFALFINFCFYLIPNIFGQLKVTLPVERAVFQRVNNVASIHIGGNIPFPTDQIQAKLTPIQGGQAIDWRSIDAQISNGNFVGELSYVTGGWYKLEVRAMANGTQIGDISTVSKVGVGEVFIVAGQSNAQGGKPPMGGFYDNTAYAASDDRVNCIDFFDSDINSLLPFPKISQLKADTKIAPHGQASWCWGILGDKIAKELNVPVLFFNAAEGGTRINQWAKAAKGESTVNYYTNLPAPLGYPYNFLRKSIHYYASLFGLRAVLWHQGEDDGFINTSEASYQADLETVINKSREHTGKNITWMVAKVSRSRVGVKESITNAQQNIINLNGFNVFQGPSTDDIQPSVLLRDDGVHFRGTGFIELANAWSNFIINENFLLNSKPFLANPPIKLKVENCQVNYEINASLPNNYTEPTWVWNGGNNVLTSYSKTIIAFDQNYGLVKDFNKNFLMSPPFTFSPANIGIKVDSNPKICDGQSLSVEAISVNNNFLWSNGEKTNKINISKGGNYQLSVSSYDVYGCQSKADANFNLNILPLPPAPIIESGGNTTFCDGGSVEIKEKTNTNFNKLWNTQETSSTIKVQKSGNYSLQNIDVNGCKSVSSNLVGVIVNPLPNKPEIRAEGKPQYCFGDSVKLISTTASGYFWKTESADIKTNKNELFAKKQGSYKLVVTNEYGCESVVSEPISIIEKPLPVTPKIEVVGRAAICAGDTTSIITKNTAYTYSWTSNGGNVEASTNQTLKIATSQSGNSVEKIYSLKIADENGCVSLPSNLVKITVKSRPISPTIEQIGPYTVLAKMPSATIPNSFIWYLNQVTIKDTSSIIKANIGGNYQVKSAQNYLIDNEKLLCISDISSALPLNSIASEIILYPNPITNGSLFLETAKDVSNLSLRLFTITGNKVFEAKNINTSKRVNLELGGLKGFFIAEINLEGTIIRKNIWLR